MFRVKKKLTDEREREREREREKKKKNQGEKHQKKVSQGGNRYKRKPIIYKEKN